VLQTAGRAPNAVLCVNDTLALGAIRALHDAGLRAPADLAIAGFDDIEDVRNGARSRVASGSTATRARFGLSGAAVVSVSTE
jgi:ABC-type sugar transport system substrate-binding protein